MKLNLLVIFNLLLLQSLVVLSACRPSEDFDFFYFVQQWPGSYCDSNRGCCFPTTGKPVADFTVHGLWPNYNDGSYPSNCDSSNPFDDSKVSDLISSMRKYWPTLACPSGSSTEFWSHEWNKHGTCSESVFDEHAYFSKALELRKTANILENLASASIHPDDGFYWLSDIKEVIQRSSGFEPFIECNKDSEVIAKCTRCICALARMVNSSNVR